MWIDQRNTKILDSWRLDIIGKGMISFRKYKDHPVVFHITVGILLGYFLLHPFTMVIYWLEMNGNNLTFSSFFEAFNERFAHSFSPHMIPMAAVFVIIGGLTGLISGIQVKIMRDQQQKINSQNYQLKESIQNLIRNGESETVEFKSSFRFDFRKSQINKALEDAVIKTIAGFMNAHGGILILGVDDNGNVLGLNKDYDGLIKKNRDGFEQKVMQTIADKLGTDLCPFVHLYFHFVAESEVCSVYVEKAHRPVFLQAGGTTIFYLRTGNTTKPLNTMETVEYLNPKNQNSRI
jgi:hypothetical protein